MSYFIPEPRNFAEVARLPANVKNDLLKATLKKVKNIINNQNLLMDDPEKVDPVIPFMDVYQ